MRFRRDLAALGVAVADQPVASSTGRRARWWSARPASTSTSTRVDALAPRPMRPCNDDEPAPLAAGVARRFSGSPSARPRPAPPRRSRRTDADDACAPTTRRSPSSAPARRAPRHRRGHARRDRGTAPARRMTAAEGRERPSTLPPVRTSTLRNVARNALRPHYLPVMGRKLVGGCARATATTRCGGPRPRPELDRASATSSTPALGGVRAWADEFRVSARKRSTRWPCRCVAAATSGSSTSSCGTCSRGSCSRPESAAGYTSQAILHRHRGERRGHPVLERLPVLPADAPERYVGCLVDERSADPLAPRTARRPGEPGRVPAADRHPRLRPLRLGQEHRGP